VCEPFLFFPSLSLSSPLAGLNRFRKKKWKKGAVAANMYDLWLIVIGARRILKPLAARPAACLMTPPTDFGLSIPLSMFELRETGDCDIFPGLYDGDWWS